MQTLPDGIAMNQAIERDAVLNPCLKLCKKLELAGYILQYRRLDVFDKTHIEGSPDIEIWLAHDGYVLLFMAECKRPNDGVQSDVQIAYEEKYKPFKNVQYQLITSPEELEYFIRKLVDAKIPASWSVEVDEHMNLNIEKGTDI
jgi:hypothetical protein